MGTKSRQPTNRAPRRQPPPKVMYASLTPPTSTSGGATAAIEGDEVQVAQVDKIDTQNA